IVSTLQTLSHQILENNSSKQVIQIPKLLQSLFELSRYKVETHLREEIDRLRLEVRSFSRKCLYCIQFKGDAQAQSDLVTQGYGRVMSISICTAGGKGEEQDEKIYNGLGRITDFLIGLHLGRTQQPSFQPLPLLARRSEEQIEEEGADEELEAQMNNNGDYGHIRNWAKWAKAMTLNSFINWD
ncbi:MAG: hypothetical protein EZS28_026024, partial [Streblomastix strix]